MADPKLPETVLRTGADAYAFFSERLAAGDAAIRVAHLDAGSRVIGVSIHDASLNAADLPIQAILREALTRDGAALLLAQNRLAGAGAPGDADADATRRLAEAARRLGIRLLDRLLFTADGCDSLRQLGLL